MERFQFVLILLNHIVALTLQISTLTCIRQGCWLILWMVLKIIRAIFLLFWYVYFYKILGEMDVREQLLRNVKKEVSEGTIY